MADTTEKARKAPRALNASEVYARISSVNKGGAKALLFMKTSAGERVLDETYGPLGWEFGGDDVLRLWNPTGNTWVAKSNPLPQTSGITETDPFKRGCLRAGVGSELYNTPEMYIRKNFLMGWKQVTAKDASGNPTFSYQCDDYIKITGLDHDDGGAITAIHADIAHAGIIHHRAVFKKEGATIEAVEAAKPMQQAEPAAETPTASVSVPTAEAKRKSLFNDNEVLLFGNSQLAGKSYGAILKDPKALESWKGLLHWTLTAQPTYVKSPTEETRMKREQFFKAKKMAEEGLY